MARAAECLKIRRRRVDGPPAHERKFEMIKAIGLSLLVLSAPAFASLELANKNACMGCHAMATKVLGPSYQEVAKKYAGQKDAQAALAKSIKAGGAGQWGQVPMPAQPQLSDADAAKLAAWILGGTK
jgi:cytochrome c